MTVFPEVRASVDAALVGREAASTRLADEADTVARCCRDMAVRFHRGGKLIVFGNGGASADANHVAVEFVHPVIVGKPALPALSLNNDVATITDVANGVGFSHVFAHQLRCLAEPADIALGVSPDGRCANVVEGLAAAAEMGLLTVALAGGDGGEMAAGADVDHALVVDATDPIVCKEVHVTTYHILWELVHVFLEQPGVLAREARA
ncbi:D-sedoheptulose-7-phosphate isomerase [Salinactinospora qingdaonensis]|uniref:SIS domain-containing protein n=1 Tax=Salinactinospora qingdaonensis TaxID=702744 RepID=A0ABP7FCP7_9ACTN